MSAAEQRPLLPGPHPHHQSEPDPPMTSIITTGLVGRSSALIAQAGLLLFIIALWSILLAHPAGLFTYHPAFNSVAVVLLAEGVLLLQPTAAPGEKKKGLWGHRTLQALGSISVIIGTSFIFYNKAIHNAPHITTYHGLFGILTLLLILLQALFGVLVSTPALTSSFLPISTAKSTWRYHRLAGYAILTLMFTTVTLALLEADWVKMNSTRVERDLATIGLWVGAGVGGVWGIRTTKLSKGGGVPARP